MMTPAIVPPAAQAEIKPGQNGAAFSRRYPGATPAQLWFVAKRALKKNDNGQLAITVDESAMKLKVEGSAYGLPAAFALQVDGEIISVTVLKYPPMLRGKLDQIILRSLDRVPAHLAELGRTAPAAR